MPTKWDFKTLVTEEELAKDAVLHKVIKLVIQHTEQGTYQVLLRRENFKSWAALATRRAPYYPKQFMYKDVLIERMANRFPYLREITIEDLNPRISKIVINNS